MRRNRGRVVSARTWVGGGGGLEAFFTPPRMPARPEVCCGRDALEVPFSTPSPGGGRRRPPGPLTHALPKPMIRMANRPVVAYAVEALVANGVTDITLVVGPRRAKLQSFSATEPAAARASATCSRTSSWARPTPSPRPRSATTTSSPWSATTSWTLGSSGTCWTRRGSSASSSSARPPPTKYGVVTLDEDRVARIEEKPLDYRSETVNTGVSYLSRGFQPKLEDRVRRGIGRLSLVLQDLIAGGSHVAAVRSEGPWMDAVHPWNLPEVNEAIVRCRVAAAPTGDAVASGAGTTVWPTTAIVGPALVGSGCFLEGGVALGPTAASGTTSPSGPTAWSGTASRWTMSGSARAASCATTPSRRA